MNRRRGGSVRDAVSHTPGTHSVDLCRKSAYAPWLVDFIRLLCPLPGPLLAFHRPQTAPQDLRTRSEVPVQPRRSGPAVQPNPMAGTVYIRLPEVPVQRKSIRRRAVRMYVSFQRAMPPAPCPPLGSPQWRAAYPTPPRRVPCPGPGLRSSCRQSSGTPELRVPA